MAIASPTIMGTLKGDLTGIYNCKNIEIIALPSEDSLYQFSH